MTKLYDEKCEKVVDFLINLTEHTDIAEDEPGRIKLKVSLTAYKKVVEGVDGLDLSEVLKSFTGIKKYDFSLLWRTIEIDYDTSIIDRTLWKELIGARSNATGKQQVKESLMSLFCKHVK